MCGCKKKAVQKFQYTSADGKTTRTYSSKAEAQTQVQRKGGTWRAL
jgi:hypothetical protein